MSKISMSKTSLDSMANKVHKIGAEIETLEARVDKVNNFLDMDVKGRSNIGTNLTKIKSNLKKEKDFYSGVQTGIKRTKEDMFGEDSLIKSIIIGTFGVILSIISGVGVYVSDVLKNLTDTTKDSTAAEQTNQATQTSSTVTGDVNKVKEAIPEGTKWDSNTEYDGTSACFAFARKAFKIMFGEDMSNAYSGSKKYNYGKLKNVELAGRLEETTSSVTTDEIKNCLSSAVEGDVLQVARYTSKKPGETTPHTMIVESVDENGIRVYHGNWQGQVCSTYFTWDEFKKNFLRNPDDKAGVGVSIYRHA